MNPLETLLQRLFAQAQTRPDLAQTAPVSTFAGRLAHAGETPQQVLQRFPMGSGEGDLPTALAATAGAMAQPAMQGASGLLLKALAPKLLAATLGSRPQSAPIPPTPITAPTTPIPLKSNLSGIPHIPGTYRAIGLERAGGSMNPAQYLANAQAQPDYPRFIQLVQNMARRSQNLGPDFPVFRGKELNDPLMKALAGGMEQLPTTAVSTDPNVALNFAQGAASTLRKPAALAAGRATPESIVGLLPTRNTNARAESELLINPNLMPQRPQLVGNVNVDSSGMPYYNTPRTPQGGGNSIEDIIAALHQAAGTGPVEELQRALSSAAQPLE